MSGDVHVRFCERLGVQFLRATNSSIVQAMIARGVIRDCREPEFMRFAVTPLYLGFADVWDAVEILRDILDGRAWGCPEFRRRGIVT